MGKMHRAQILLDPDQHTTLAEIARMEDTSISEIVRMAVSQWLMERRADKMLQRRLEDLGQIDRHRRAILARRDGKPLEADLAAIFEQIREARDDELHTNAYGDRR